MFLKRSTRSHISTSQVRKLRSKKAKRIRKPFSLENHVELSLFWNILNFQSFYQNADMVSQAGLPPNSVAYLGN